MRADVRRLLPPCVGGGALGALLALALGAKVFAAVVPALLALGALLLLLQPIVSRFLEKHLALSEHPLAFTVGTFVLAVYGGYFGAGGGILFLAALALLLPRPFDQGAPAEGAPKPLPEMRTPSKGLPRPFGK